MKKNYFIIAFLLILGLYANAKDGLYVEFKLTSSAVSGTIKTYAMGGNTRTESNMQMQMQGMQRQMMVATLTLQDNPGVVYSLNETGKTYTVTSTKNSHTDDEEYEVTVIGKETVNNFNSTHVKVLNKKTQKTMDMWLSKDIKNYSLYATVKNKYYGEGKLFTDLKAKGADGYVARMVIEDDRAGQIQMDLIKAESKPVDESLFSLDGYTKSALVAPGNVSPGNPDAKAIQNMTPEERAKYMQQMKDKYQQQQH